MSGDVIDGTVVEEPGTAMIPVPPPVPRLAVTPQVGASELVARLAVIKEAMDTAMVPNVDYGVIPGTNSKPTLLKPGAEKLAVLFQLDVQSVSEKQWGPGDHLTVTTHSTVWHAPTGTRLGDGEGLCTTREKKYGKREQKRACPNCGAETIFKSKKDGEGWYCWAKKGGCGAQFSNANDPRIVDQRVGEVDNPEIPDHWNTTIKMAKKRALIDAVLVTTGASAIFTQDLEDQAGSSGSPPAGPPAPVVSADDVTEILEAARGLSPRRLRMVLGSLGLPAPAPAAGSPLDQARSILAEVPLDAVDRVIAAVEKAERPSAEASA